MFYDTAFFDLDGTLTDSVPGIVNSVKYALEKGGYPPLTQGRGVERAPVGAVP